MGFISSVTKIPNFMMKIASSIFSGGSFICGASGMSKLIDAVFNFLSKIFYFVSKWMLFILDILFSFIRQLCGLEMKYDSLETMVSKESDFVFNLLLTATDTITPIIKNLIGLAIALILFFAILAVIKTSFESLKNKSPADIKGVVAKTLRAFVLLIITPMLAIVGIVASNTILKSLYNATNTTNSNSLSAQLFSASATSASAYRIYAQNGLKIPMTFDFTKQMEIVEYYKDKPVTDEFREYVGSVENIIFTNYKDFNEGAFTEFRLLNDTYSSTGSAAERASVYYNYYDRHPDAFNPSGATNGVNAYKKILAYRPEYYVMADVIDFCINTGNKAYFKTVQEMLDSVAEVGDDNLFNSVVRMFDIKFLDGDLKQYVTRPVTNANTEVYSSFSTLREVFKKEGWRVIRFESTYYDADDSSNPTRKMDIQYNHVRGATDELAGAKYIMCIGKDIKLMTGMGEVKHFYYYPLTIGYSSGEESGFASDFVQMNQMIAAKGIFSESTYPTAIRQTEDGAEIQFYRQNLITVTVGDPEAVGTGGMKSEEKKSGLAKFFEKLKSLFNPKVDANIDTEQVVTAYTYEEVIVNNLASGTLSLSYMFEDSFTSFLGGIVNGASNAIRSASGAEGTEQLGLFGLKLEHVFIPRKINMIVLVMGSLLLLKIVFTSIFVLINRAYELFLTIIIYPTACATIPIDEAGYQQWTRTYVGRLFSTYGLILGLNFVLMLFPIISNLEIFTAAEIALSKPLMRFKNLFSLGGIIPISLEFLASFLNLVCIILFELVAFTLLETLPETISQIVGAANVKGINPIETFAKAFRVVMSVVTTVASEGSGFFKSLWDMFLAVSPNKKARDQARARIKQKTKDKMDQMKKKAMKFVPGSEIVGAAKDKKNLNEKKNAQKDAMADLKESMNGGKKVKDEKTGQERDMTPEERAKDVEESFNKMLEAQSSYSAALKDPRGNREAEDEKKREEKESGLDESSRDDEDMEHDEDGNETGEAADVSHKSKRQLKKAKKRQKAIVKNLERKERLGTITDAERQSLDRQKKKLDKTEEALGGKKDYAKAKKEMERLQKKQGGGALTAGEQNELNMYAAKVQEYENAHQKGSDKQVAKDRKAASKERKRDKAAAEKAAEQQKKIRQKFTSGSKMAQRSYMKSNERTQAKMAKKLGKAGIRPEDIDLQNATGLSAKQKRQVAKYQQAGAQLDSAKKVMTDYADTKATYDAQRQAHYDMYKNRNKAGTKGGSKLLAKTRGGEQDRETQLKLIDTQLEAIKQQGVDGSNLKKYQELQQRKAKLQGEQRFQERWAGQTTKTKQQLKAESKAYRQREKEKAYQWDTKTYEKAESEIEKEARKRLKAKKKLNPTDAELKKEIDAIKEESKNGGATDKK